MIAKAGFSYPTFVECESGWANYLAIGRRATNTRKLQKLVAKQFRKNIRTCSAMRERLARVYADATTGESILAFSSYDLPLLL